MQEVNFGNDLGSLLKEHFFRIFHSKAPLITLLVFMAMVALNVFSMVAINWVQSEFFIVIGTIVTEENYYEIYSSLNDVFSVFNPTDFLGIILAVVFSVFFGAEYTQHTLRNKVTTGYSRLSIYVSNVIVEYVFAFVFVICGAIVLFALGLPLLGWHATEATSLDLLESMMMLFPIVAVLNLIQFLAKGTGTAIGISIGFFVVGSVASMAIGGMAMDNVVCRWITRLCFLPMDGYLRTFVIGSSIGMEDFFKDVALQYVWQNAVVLHVVWTGLLLWLGYLSFRKAELK